ncbi:hypothetical protein CY34DRAFT_402945 [Suillus luteus UH-Slu-Lm8-n1]|uniref:Uncharacterized protein n=1 Tax=Suillus luteus UH-Slu-Lm8-n1 TaxID=930992 RepID=A0A0C9ZLA7_9AGAM|nr:hypothetical protein CY34DRAFT_402945 [Suillus luteus UH-Slu-Lm8-n1]
MVLHQNYTNLPLAGPSSKVIKGLLPDFHLSKHVEYRQAFLMACKKAPIPPQLILPILVLPHITLAALLHPLLQIYMPFSIASRHSSTTLDPISMQQLNFNNAQPAPSSLAVLVLS